MGGGGSGSTSVNTNWKRDPPARKSRVTDPTTEVLGDKLRQDSRFLREAEGTRADRRLPKAADLFILNGLPQERGCSFGFRR